MGAIKPWHVIVLIVCVLLPLLVLAAVVALVVALVRRSRSAPSDAQQQSVSPQQGSPAPRTEAEPAPASEDPRTILDRRLALGEISPEEHARLRQILDVANGRNP